MYLEKPDPQHCFLISKDQHQQGLNEKHGISSFVD